MVVCVKLASVADGHNEDNNHADEAIQQWQHVYYSALHHAMQRITAVFPMPSDSLMLRYFNFGDRICSCLVDGSCVLPMAVALAV